MANTVSSSNVRAAPDHVLAEYERWTQEIKAAHMTAE